METLGKICEEGCDLSLDRWLDPSFILPFKISSEPANYGPDLSEKILQQPIIPNGKYSLFMEFEKPTTYVLRVTVIYRQAHILAIDQERHVFKNYDIGKLHTILYNIAISKL